MKLNFFKLIFTQVPIRRIRKLNRESTPNAEISIEELLLGLWNEEYSLEPSSFVQPFPFQRTWGWPEDELFWMKKDFQTKNKPKIWVNPFI